MGRRRTDYHDVALFVRIGHDGRKKVPPDQCFETGQAQIGPMFFSEVLALYRRQEENIEC